MPVVTVAYDSYVRANQSGWGTSSDTEPWAQTAGTATPSILSNQGKITGATGSNNLVLGSATYNDVVAVVRVSATSATDIVGILLRYGASNARFEYSSGVLRLRIAGAIIASASAVFTANTPYWLKVQSSGSTYTARAWADGASEPSTWALTCTDSSLGAGKLGLFASLAAGTDSAFFDNFTVTVTPATYYVAPTGSDSNAGTSSGSPWLTLAKVVAVAQLGDTINVASGTYTGGVTFTNAGSAANPITLQSTVRWGAKIIEPGGAGVGTTIVAFNGDYSVFDGFEVTGADANYGVSCGGNFNTVSHCWVHDICNTLSLGAGVGGAGIVNFRTNYVGSGARITNNRIERVGPTVGHAAGAAIVESDYVHTIYVMCDNALAGAQGEISNNLIIQSSGWGIAMYHNPNHWLVTNNTIVKGLLGGIDCWGETGLGYFADYNVIQNNILMQCGGVSTSWKPAIWSQSDSCGAHNTFRNNLAYYSGGTAIYDFTTASVKPLQTASNRPNANPQFVNYTGDGTGDYHLLLSSPAIGTGAASSTPALDFDGATRPGAAGYGIGYVQFVYPAGTVVSVGGSPISIYRPDGVHIHDKANARSTATFTVIGSVASQLSQKQAVTISDGVLGVQFAGTIDSIAFSRISPNTTYLWQVTCIDKVAIAQKRIYTGPELSGYLAGDAVALMHQATLANEGVTASVAVRSDNTQAGWAQGTLAGVQAMSDGTLVLTPAGTPFVITEDTYPQWTAAGAVLTNTTVSGANALVLTAGASLKMTGTTQPGVTTDLICAFAFWQGSLACASGDFFDYDIWIDPSNPVQNGGVDLIATDGSRHRDTVQADALGVSGNTATDLSTYASGRWYHRHIKLDPSWNSKHIGQVVAVLDGDTAGTYAIYLRNIGYFALGGALKATFYGSGALQSNVIQKNVGYSNVSVTVVNSYDGVGTRVSPVYTNTTCPKVLDSFVVWSETDPPTTTGGGSSTAPPPVLIELSYDNGATWVTLINRAPIPTLPSGAALSGASFLTRITLTASGSQPLVSPSVDYLVITLRPTAACTFSTFSDIDKASAGDFATGTLAGVVSSTAQGLTLPNSNTLADWNVGDLTGMTLVGSGAPVQTPWYGGIQITVDPSGYATSFYMTPGTMTNCIMEIDIQLPAGGGNSGLVYRTTYLGAGSGPNCFGYAAKLSTTQLEFGHGSNSSTDGWTSILAVAGTYQAGQWYHMTVIVNGTSHTISIDGTTLIATTDSWYTGAGNIGIRWSNHLGTVRESTVFDNLGILKGAGSLPLSGTRTNPSVALSGVAGNSMIVWNALVPSNTTLEIDASLDNGATWAACTNGAPIPGVTAGLSLAGKTLIVREILTTSNIGVTPMLTGLHSVIYGQFSASGSRISPALDLGAIGRVGSTSLAWDATLPTGTALVTETSTDGSTWAATALGGPITGIANQPAQFAEKYAVDHSANWTSTFEAGGAAATPTWVTASSQLSLAGGTNALYIWTTSGPAYKDGQLIATLSQSDNGGLVARYTGTGNFYYLLVRDASSSQSPASLVQLWRRAGSVNTQIGGNAAITFTRGHPHTLAWSLAGASHSITWDGAVVLAVTDAAPLAPSGSVGYFQTAVTAPSLWYGLVAQGLGDDVTGKSGYSRLTLSSTNPAALPVVRAVTLAARGPTIMDGAILTQTNYQYKSVSSNTDDAAKQSNYWWNIDKSGQYWFQNRAATLAPWPLWSGLHADGSCDLQWSPQPVVTHQSPAYRNRQYVTDAYDIVSIPEKKIGDGNVTSWSLGAPISSITTLTVNGQTRTWGIQGVDTGRDLYYTEGQTQLAQDQAAAPLAPGALLAITYKGIVPYTAMKEDTGQQAILAALDGTTGIVEMQESGAGLNKAAADALAQARITQYAILTRSWVVQTMRAGLAVGQLHTVFAPEFNLNDADLLISEIVTDITEKADSTSLTLYTVTETEGPPLGSWARIFVLN